MRQDGGMLDNGRVRLEFTKMHGCGNDYIYINCFEQEIDDPKDLPSPFQTGTSA